jgi:hypothetical protein
MIPRNVIKKSDVQSAAEHIVANGFPNNSTKYDAELTIDGVVHRIAPKKLVSTAFKVATGEPHPVSKFSGGYETNKFLKGFDVNVISKVN